MDLKKVPGLDMITGLKKRMDPEKLNRMKSVSGIKRIKRWHLIAGALICMVLLAAAFLGGGEEVETVKMQPGSIVRMVEDTGYVQMASDYYFEATQSARVAQIPVETGQVVEQGQPLVILENLDLAVQISEAASRLAQVQAADGAAEAALAKMQLLLDNARTQLERTKELYDIGAVSKADYEQATLEVQTYQKSLRELEVNLQSSRDQVFETGRMLEQLREKEKQLTILSPVEGRILALPVKQEQAVTPGVPLVKVGVPGELEIKVDIISDDLGAVREGQKTLVSAPVLGDRVIEGEVKKIYPQAEEKLSALGVIQRRVPVIISIADESGLLQPGYEVKVAIETLNVQGVPVLPREAIRTNAAGEKEVMKIVGKKVKLQAVKTGLNDSSNIEIVSGLKAGDVVVKDVGQELKENTRVKVK